MKKNIIKEKGRVYTPLYIVENILDMAGYHGRNILKKHVIDNSCGDGAFLSEIIKRYCIEAEKSKMPREELLSDLENYIHGIEIDPVERESCLKNLTKITNSFNIKNVRWDIICADALTINKYDGKMDFVLGNPPYVRVHNFGDSFYSVKSFDSAKSGMSDLYLVFYEIGINMLSHNGVLGYITPSSFFNSLAGCFLRKEIVDNNLLDKLCDLQHYQVFESTTYTTIAILKKNKSHDMVEYFRFDNKNKIPYYVDTLVASDFYIKGNFYFAEKEQLAILSKILSNFNKSDILVKNGYATLCDSVFINDFDFDSKYIIPVIKSSKGTKKRIFFPYDKQGNLIPENEIMSDKALYSYLLNYKDKLVRRSNEKKDEKFWYAFGRSQAIRDTYKNKLTINSLIRDENDLKFVYAPAGTGVYGGLYITSVSIPFEIIKETLQSKEFATYISLLGKYKNGGYYTFSSKDIKAYLDYKITYQGE